MTGICAGTGMASGGGEAGSIQGHEKTGIKSSLCGLRDELRGERRLGWQQFMLSHAMRPLAIGDIHGCLTALEALLDELRPGPNDTVVTLGDYVDRGPDSKGVIDRLLKLAGETTLVPLLGNHDQLFLEVLEGQHDHLESWLGVGGVETLQSYGGIDNVPEAHRRFLSRECRLYYEPAGEGVFFVHGSASPILPLDLQAEEWLLWRRFHEARTLHVSGRVMVCGHTAQRSGRPVVEPHVVCIDTWAFGEGWLTAYDVHAATFLQANQAGEVRRLTLQELSV